MRPGLGTLLNAVLVGLAMDATLWLVAPATLGVRVGELAVGIGLVGVGSGFYLGAALGPGPRDGLMTGLHERTGRSVALIRTALELSAFALGPCSAAPSDPERWPSPSSSARWWRPP